MNYKQVCDLFRTQGIDVALLFQKHEIVPREGTTEILASIRVLSEQEKNDPRIYHIYYYLTSQLYGYKGYQISRLSELSTRKIYLMAIAKDIEGNVIHEFQTTPCEFDEWFSGENQAFAKEIRRMIDERPYQVISRESNQDAL